MGGRMTTYALGFQDIDRSTWPVVGGKGANLGELARIDGIRVPDGFCVTTDAFRDITRDHGELDGLLHDLSLLDATARSAISETSARIRRVIEEAPMPQSVARAIAEHIAKIGEGHAYAVRSSATAEDLPSASFAGQQDTYLNVIGTQSVLAHVRRCWASLFTDRAVTYRLHNGIDQLRVQTRHLLQIIDRFEVAVLGTIRDNCLGTVSRYSEEALDLIRIGEVNVDLAEVLTEVPEDRRLLFVSELGTQFGHFLNYSIPLPTGSAVRCRIFQAMALTAFSGKEFLSFSFRQLLLTNRTSSRCNER